MGTSFTVKWNYHFLSHQHYQFNNKRKTYEHMGDRQWRSFSLHYQAIRYTNTTSYNHVFILFIEPYVPYLVDITAATIIGKGEISQKTFFTLETSTSVLLW